MQHEVKKANLTDLVRDVNGRMNEMSEIVSVREERQLQTLRNFMIFLLKEKRFSKRDMWLVKKPQMIYNLADSWD